ncbi:MAG: PAS domain-containing protein [Chloroflexi bacterium]|nr:PAS domain-containing protein [Chloroflexota bacterium]
MSALSDLADAQRLIAYLTRFEDLIASLAQSFIDTNAQTLDRDIDHSLRQIADFVGTTRTYLFLLDAEAQILFHVYAWGDRELRRHWGAGVSLERLDWLVPRLQNAQPVTLAAADVPEPARAEFGLPLGHTLVAAPLLAQDGIFGFLGTDWPPENTPTDYDRKLLAQTAAFITGALERQRGEHARAQEMKLLRALIDSVPDMLFAKDTESRFTLNNFAHIQALGAESPEAARGKTDHDFFPSANSDQYRADERQVIQGKVIDKEEPVITADGAHRWVHVTKVPYRDALGNIIGLVGISRDITDRKNYEEQVREKERLLRTVIDNIPSLIFVKDRECRYLLGNASALRYLGVPNEAALIGKSDFDFYPRQLAEQYHAREAELLETGQALLNFEEPSINHQTETATWYNSNRLALRDDHGLIVGLVGINHDITQRKQMEQELRRAQAELEKRVAERTAELQQAHAQLQHELEERRQQQIEFARLQQQIIEAQKQAILELSTPIIPIIDHVIVMPLVGMIDTARAREITRALLAGISHYRAQLVILDITGVSMVDSGVANHLNKTIQAARLKGAQTIVTGITDAVAETIVDLGIDWSTLDTLRDLQSGLHIAFQRKGYLLRRA